MIDTEKHLVQLDIPGNDSGMWQLTAHSRFDGSGRSRRFLVHPEEYNEWLSFWKAEDPTFHHVENMMLLLGME